MIVATIVSISMIWIYSKAETQIRRIPLWALENRLTAAFRIPEVSSDSMPYKSRENPVFSYVLGTVEEYQYPYIHKLSKWG
jgi:hypothetical protein